MQSAPRSIDEPGKKCFNAIKGFRWPMATWRRFQIHFKKVEENKT